MRRGVVDEGCDDDDAVGTARGLMGAASFWSCLWGGDGGGLGERA
jgi:hypothetical protein